MDDAGAVSIAVDILGGGKLLGALGGTPADACRTCDAAAAACIDAAPGLSSLTADAAAAWSGLSVVLGMASCRRLSSSCVLC